MFDPESPWQLSSQVSVRPEPFGALLYHFGTRKLSFLKDRTLVQIVESLQDHPSARAAVAAAGVAETSQDIYIKAVNSLVDSHMVVAQDA
ncbi:mycofactocin biosynthesis chaperone MftB [Nesterenkonia haasae]|uniref:mycofactocin biosynthesis chaperone MftB n=1 Tax=Nesterenkonia haasae TaxID=2587813 RepID=UPI0013915684|nr:mycofactocin biosynthesis chaperone MftB [Nesterenkonia haasae]NDK30215.1 mycofactocin biosynthesis chaperone MftB [Nesterenkonia haasae]